MESQALAGTSTQRKGIEVRARVIDWEFQDIPFNWAGEPGLTQFLNMFSVMAPHTEGWAVKLSRLALQERPQDSRTREVGGFCGQEARHALAHRQFNKEVLEEQQGLDLSQINGAMRFMFKRMEQWPLQEQMASLSAGEHFLGIVARWYLEDVDRSRVHHKCDRLFAWHCAEEMEHCAVAFELYDDLYGKGISAALIKRRALLKVTMSLARLLYEMWEGLMAQARARDPIETSMNGAARYLAEARKIRDLLVTMMRETQHYFSYYRPGYHPWQDHDKYLPLLDRVFVEVGAVR